MANTEQIRTNTIEYDSFIIREIRSVFELYLVLYRTKTECQEKLIHIFENKTFTVILA